MSTEENRKLTIVELVMIILQLILIPVLFSFDTRIRKLEVQTPRMMEMERKMDRILDMQEKQQQELTQFYKEYGAALEFAKREMQKK